MKIVKCGHKVHGNVHGRMCVVQDSTKNFRFCLIDYKFATGKTCARRQKFGDIVRASSPYVAIDCDSPSSNFQHLIYVKPFSDVRKAASFREGRGRNYRKLSRIFPPISLCLRFCLSENPRAYALAEGRNIRWDMRSFV